MKKIILFTLLIAFICYKKKQNIDKKFDSDFDSSQLATLKQGGLSSNTYKISGAIKLFQYNNSKTLFFKGFNCESGPTFNVYLSTSTLNTDFKELRDLKALFGNFYYTFDNIINTDTYKYVLIYCKQYSVLLGKTKLN